MNAPTLTERLAASVEAAAHLAHASLDERAALLRSLAQGLELESENLIAIAAAETALGIERLRGELARTAFQLRFFADIVSDGAFLQATVDHADPAWPPAPRPDLRSVRQPFGPVLVFAGGNFPFAFSVLGGDTASALAAGCPVLVKAHPGHPRLSIAVTRTAREVARQAGFPAGVLDLVHDEAEGRAALQHPAIKAAAFTGSLRGGRALYDLACARPGPIPFYGELGSLNPVFVTPRAARSRAQEIAAGFRASFTQGVGQFCTKPGLLVVPREMDLDVFAHGLSDTPPAPMLTDRIAEVFTTRVDELLDAPGLSVLVHGKSDGARSAAPTLLATTVSDALSLPEVLLTEAFGPSSLIATYRDEQEALALARGIEGQLTATVFAAQDDDPVAARLIPALAERAGRVIVGGWPTGVAVTWAMQHGGPYPASTADGSTSVGARAIDRFLRTVAYQSVPDALLPAALREANPLGIARRVDGIAEGSTS